MRPIKLSEMLQNAKTMTNLDQQNEIPSVEWDEIHSEDDNIDHPGNREDMRIYSLNLEEWDDNKLEDLSSISGISSVEVASNQKDQNQDMKNQKKK